MILIISHPEDIHARTVFEQVERLGGQPLLLDTSNIPVHAKVTIEHGRGPWNGAIEIAGAVHPMRDVRAVWWRRPQPFRLDENVGGLDDRHFALGETHAAISGLWALLEASWINDPEKDERASRKAWQLQVAKRAGLAIPRTCITNDPSRARSFLDEVGGTVIYKAFSATEKTWRETRVICEQERTLLENVRFAPVIFQEYVPAGVDLRITIVGNQVFAAEIHSQSTSYIYDFRMDMDHAEIASHELPGKVQRDLLSLMRRLGLTYGAIDMRRTPSGQYVFLEINPAGQWLFVEQRTSQPISQTLAQELVRRGQALERVG